VPTDQQPMNEVGMTSLGVLGVPVSSYAGAGYCSLSGWLLIRLSSIQLFSSCRQLNSGRC
jgi:hypothetical protein